LLVVAGAVGGWWYSGGLRSVWPASASAVSETPPAEPAPQEEKPIVVTLPEAGDQTVAAAPDYSEDEVLEPVGQVLPGLTLAETDDPPATPPSATNEPAGDSTGNPAIEALQRRMKAGETLAARSGLNAMLTENLPRADKAEVRRLLTELGEQTIFSRRCIPGDPLVGDYVVQSGDALVRIGREYHVPAETLMRINGISDPRLLRADQKIKVLRGPFHVRIEKSDFRMDVYLQDQYVRSFRVGLGADQGTPEGQWRVKERLENPTYYPPASAEVKRVIPPGDPTNPLGGHWIGLEGVSGDAVGRVGYGIHGTIEPDSIGKAVSMGCVRMRNEDVALLYALLLPGESTVTIVP
jgi:lipoprotein-anchoring transpeptidase ErfK/SrfK